MTKPAAHIKHTTGRQKLVSIVPTIAQHVNRLACTLLARRGTITLKPKGLGLKNPVCEDTFDTAVATLAEKKGFVTPKFWELVRLHGFHMVYGGMGLRYSKDCAQSVRTPARLYPCLQHPVHLLCVKTQSMVPKPHTGAPTMTASKGQTAPTSKAAPAITTTKQPLDSETWCELQNLNDIVNLCAFAADARRTLEGVSEVRRWHQNTDKLINDRVTASNNWDTHHDTLPNVLAHVNARLQDLLTAGEGMD